MKESRGCLFDDEESYYEDLEGNDYPVNLEDDCGS
jgi:hypothetical protein